MINLNMFSMKFWFSLSLLCLALAARAGDPALVYIRTYSDIVVKEMQRTGIPASIKMAQALLESEVGKSPLAARGNNHFGIKCGKDWDGGTYFKIDDDTDSTGVLIESCFRAFTKAEESFVAHSEFLTDSRKQHRYGFLFELYPGDYEAWARGLSAAGYATDPAYPEKLIRIIKKYKLDTLDEPLLASLPTRPKLHVQEEQPEVVTVSEFELSRPSRLKSKEEGKKEHNMYKVIWVNDTRAIQVTADTDVETLAGDLRMAVSRITAHNEMLLTPSESITRGTTVYLENKKRDYEGRITHHVVKEGESLESISNLYGMQAQTLYVLNRIAKGYQPAAGETIALKEKVAGNQKPKVVKAGKKQRGLLFSQL